MIGVGGGRGQAESVPTVVMLVIVVLSIVFVGAEIVGQYPDAYCENEFGEEPADSAILENGSIECKYEDRTVYTDQEYKNLTAVAASLTGVS